MSNLSRPIEQDEFYRMDWFLLKLHAFISPKTAKYLRNPRFSLKVQHDSPIKGSKTSNLYRPIELDELVRMVMTSFGLIHWIPSERANPRRSADFVFSWRRCVFFMKSMKIAVTRPFSEEYSITEETGEKCLLQYIFFGLFCFPFICQRTGSERHHSIYYLITFGGISQFWGIWKHHIEVEISPFDGAHRALLICIGFRFWFPQWANRAGVLEKIRDFGGISQFCGIWKHDIEVEISPFDGAHRALSICIGLRLWSPQ